MPTRKASLCVPLLEPAIDLLQDLAYGCQWIGMLGLKPVCHIGVVAGSDQADEQK